MTGKLKRLNHKINPFWRRERHFWPRKQRHVEWAISPRKFHDSIKRWRYCVEDKGVSGWITFSTLQLNVLLRNQVQNGSCYALFPMLRWPIRFQHDTPLTVNITSCSSQQRTSLNTWDRHGQTCLIMGKTNITNTFVKFDTTTTFSLVSRNETIILTKTLNLPEGNYPNPFRHQTIRHCTATFTSTLTPIKHKSFKRHPLNDNLHWREPQFESWLTTFTQPAQIKSL